MRFLFPLSFLLCFFFTTVGQEFTYTHYDTKDGLAGSVVYCAAEDKEGFLWFGTETGLSRFDGAHFKNFTTADGLPDNEVLKLYVDSKNRIWMIPFKHSVCYYWKGKIYNSENDSILHRLSFTSDLFSIREDKHGNIIIVEQYGISVISPSGAVRKIIPVYGGMMAECGSGGTNRDKDFIFWVEYPLHLGHQVIFRLVDTAGRNPFVSIKKISIKAPQAGINCLLLTPGLIAFTDRSWLVVCPEGKKSFSLPMPEGMISVSKTDDSLIAINTHAGSSVYNIKTKKRVAHFLDNQGVNDVIRDSEGNIWFVCAGSGIFRLGSLAFRVLRFPGKGTGLAVNALQVIDNSLFISTEKGPLWRAGFPLTNVRRQRLYNYSWSSFRIGIIKKTSRNRMLLGMDAGVIELENFVVRRKILGMSIKSIVPASGDTWLICNSREAILLRLRDFKQTCIIWPTRVTCAYKKDSLFYIGTLNGLHVVTPGQPPRFLGDINPVFKRRMADFGETPDGVLWMATYGQGIAGYKNNRLLYTVTEKEGLTSNICRNLAIAGNEIWVGTDKGLNRIRRPGGRIEITRFSTTDGLSSDMINAVYADSSNVYVGTARGLTWFNANSVTAHSFCKLRITAIQTPRHNWAYDTSGMVLPHHENSIRIEYVGISFRSAGDIEYKYRMLGLNDTWHTTRETILSYPTLPSGHYELEIMAVNKFGMQAEPLRVHFVVQKLLWEESWFIVLMAVLATALIWSLVSIRIRQLKKQNREKLSTSARIVELEQKALKAQMNPHFIFNCLNSIQQYVIDKDFKGVNKFITGFSRLIRLTLEMSSKTNISLEEEVKYLSTYLELEKSRFEDKFSYHVQLQPGIDPLGYHIPSMILQPYVENSIRHGVRNRDDNDGKITISFARTDHYLECIIEDNGVGRSAAQKYKSQEHIEYQSRGMALTASRVEMINKTNAARIRIHIEDGQTDEGNPAGTRVIIRFPFDIIKPKSTLYD